MQQILSVCVFARTSLAVTEQGFCLKKLRIFSYPYDDRLIIGAVCMFHIFGCTPLDEMFVWCVAWNVRVVCSMKWHCVIWFLSWEEDIFGKIYDIEVTLAEGLYSIWETESRRKRCTHTHACAQNRSVSTFGP